MRTTRLIEINSGFKPCKTIMKRSYSLIMMKKKGKEPMEKMRMH